MRIAFLVHSFPELSETFILNQVTGVLDAGHEIDIYASGGRDGQVHGDIQRYRLREHTHYWDIPRGYLTRAIKMVGLIVEHQGWRRPRVLIRALDARTYGRRALSLSLLGTSVRWLGQKPYDIIHCQFGTLARTAVALRNIGAANGKLVVSFRGADLTTKTRRLDYAETFAKGELFLPVCERFKEMLIREGCDSRKIRVHHSGIKLPRFPFTERRRIADEPTKLLTVARLVEKKGISDAIRAVAQLKASGRSVRYTVAGDGPLRTELAAMIQQLGLQAEIHLVGPKTHEEVMCLLQDAHLLIAPSKTAGNGEQEGIPNVLKEAMATGMPVVSTRHSGIPELVEDGVSGRLVPEADSSALADALAELIDHSERWVALGRAGRRRIEADFDSDTLNKELISLYRHVLGGRG